MTSVKKMIFSAFVLCCMPVMSHAQNRVTDTASGRQFYAEVGGAGDIFSANFDSRFSKGESLGLGYRIGVGFGLYDEDNNNGSDTKSYITFPVGLNYVFGKTSSSHAFEVGAGVTMLTKSVKLYCYDNDAAKKGNMIGHFSFMYRLKPIDGGFTWRIGFTPIIGTGGDIMPSFAVGIGYSF